MNAIELLKRARALIVDEKNWCQGCMVGMGQHGQSQHCVLGAINRGAISRLDMVSIDDPVRLLDAACVRLFGEHTVRVNDFLGHDAIILALDTAIGDYPAHAIKEPDLSRELIKR